MNAVQRRMEIYRILQEQTTAEVNDLAALFSVSKMTIRRDFALFEKQGLVKTNYGGAHLNSGTAVEPSFSLKQGQLLDIKQAIAEEAAELIRDGDTIGIDCGTTTLQLLKYIQNKKITIVSNSWHIISHLQGNQRIKIILAPGEYSEVSAGVISSVTADFFHSFSLDWAFISTQGYSIGFGASVPGMDEAHVKRALMRSARQSVLMLDHSKFEQRLLFRHAKPEQFDIIVTNDETPEDYQRQLKKECKLLLVANASLSHSSHH